jgi:hypothetical protein
MPGRLIRKSASRSDPNASSYIVALSHAAEAIALIKHKVGKPGDEIKDLCRVSSPLIQALNLLDGDFVRLDDKQLSLRRVGNN